jgi:SAM-dependent methyltransferase
MSAQSYISEIDYLYGYYPEMAPAQMKLALLSSGIGHAVKEEFTYLELGFGQGLSLAINAAVSKGTFYGTDFNPAQVANAMELAEAVGKPIHLYDQSFEEFAARTDLPQFDIIALHGIWSWISDEGRRAIIEIARKRLKPGGIFYISYNVTPGWSPAMPLRHLMTEYAKRAVTGGVLERSAKAIDYVDRVISAGASYFATQPELRSRLDQIRKQDPHYVAHEYFNGEWEPMPFSRIADRLAEAKLSFACSANVIDNIPALAEPEAAGPLLAEIGDPILRQTTLDYFVNRQFRRDIFVKGPRRLGAHEFRAAVSAMRFCLLNEAVEVPSTMATAIGQVELKQDVYVPIIAVLRERDGMMMSIEEVAASPRCDGVDFWHVWEAMQILTAIGIVSPAEVIDEADDRLDHAANLNRFICSRAQAQSNIQFLASPVMGGALPVGWIDQLFLSLEELGVEEVPKAVGRILTAQGKHLILSGQEVEDGCMQAEIANLHSEFLGRKSNLIRLIP